MEQLTDLKAILHSHRANIFYIVNFSVTNGQSLKPSRTMERITLELNGKVITVQRSQNQEFYVKSQDQNGHIVTLSDDDYALIKQAATNLVSVIGNSGDDSSIETLGKVFNLLTSWSANMPLLRQSATRYAQFPTHCCIK